MTEGRDDVAVFDAMIARLWGEGGLDESAPLLPEGLLVHPGRGLRSLLRWAWGAAVGAVALGGLGMAFEADPVDAVLEVAPYFFVALVAAISGTLWLRRVPKVASLGLNDRWVSLSAGRWRPLVWSEPTPAYRGLALRSSTHSSWTRRMFAESGRFDRDYARRETTDYWIELVHHRRDRSLVLFHTVDRAPVALDRLERLAAALRLPILSRAGVRWATDADRERLAADRAAVETAS